MRGPSRIRNQARVGNGNYALLEPLRCADCCWAPPDDLGAASLSAPATAGAIALISGHALHLVVRLVLEKVPGRLPCPFIMRLGTFSKRGGTGITNRRLASKVHGGANRQQRPALFAALPGAAPGCSPIPRSSEDEFNLSGTTHCTLPISLRPAPVQISDGAGGGGSQA